MHLNPFLPQSCREKKSPIRFKSGGIIRRSSGCLFGELGRANGLEGHLTGSHLTPYDLNVARDGEEGEKQELTDETLYSADDLTVEGIEGDYEDKIEDGVYSGAGITAHSECGMRAGWTGGGEIVGAGESGAYHELVSTGSGHGRSVLGVFRW